jgi:putative Mg2+ transporter-C (MgtC) family protein
VPDVPSLGWPEVLLRLTLAAVLAGIIGIERELRDRDAGLRTHLLVSVGAALFTLVSAYGFSDFVRSGGRTSVDPTRIAAQIVTGIGFIGAGAIIRQGLSVRGLTTAATLWIAAAIGMACGAGYYTAAAITTAVVLASLWPLRIVAQRFLDPPRTQRLRVDLASGGKAAPVLAALEELGVGVDSFDIDRSGARVDVAVSVPRGTWPEDVARRLSDLADVRGLEWEG